MCWRTRIDATSPCNPPLRPASSAAVDEDAPIRVGDRVVNLQVPGVFTVVGRRGAFLDVESARGLRMSVHEVGLRRVDGTPPAAKDA